MRYFASKVLESLSKALSVPIRITYKTFWGERMYIMIPEEISLHLFRHGMYEPGLTAMILKFLKPGMIFFDIGAHYGYFTLLASNIVGKYGKVHAFEPTPNTYEILKCNSASKENVILNQCAVLERHQMVVIHDYGYEYSGFNSMFAERLPSEIASKIRTVKHKVKAVSVDEYVASVSVVPDFIKIDAESSESMILRGMDDTIKKYRPMISIEVGDAGIKGIPRSVELINYLVNKGYQAYEYKSGSIRKHDISDKQYPFENILFIMK
jgi:FkbM family methyltransferase